MSEAPGKNEIRSAQLPHQLFLFNAIGNHVLLTVITISVAMSNPMLTLLIPAISIAIIGFTLIKGATMVNHPSMLVRCHWAIVVRRTRIFLIGYLVLGLAATLGWLLFTYGGVMKELLYALVGGLGLLPFMVLILAFTIMESETLHHAGQGYVPEWAIKRFGTEQERQALAQEAAVS